MALARALAKRPKVRTRQFPQEAPEFRFKCRDVMFRGRHEIRKVDALGFDLFKMAEYDLQAALEVLNLAVDVQEIAVLEASEDNIASIPHTGGHAARAVTQFDLHVGVAVLVDAKLLLRGKEDIVQAVAVAEFVDESLGHY